MITAEITATNRDVPGSSRFMSGSNSTFEIEGASSVQRVESLIKPTRTVRPPHRYGAHWRLMSHLSLNFVSPVEGGAERDPEVLREILKLYDFGEADYVQKQILGLTAVSSRQVWRRVRTERGSGFARGVEATLEFDEDNYRGTGVYLFSSVLEKFLGLYVSINSFSETIVTTKQRGVLKRWTARSGQQPLL